MSASATRMPSPVGRLGSWARQGVDSFVAAQKILLDLTAQQNALAIGVLRERITIPTLHPGDMIADAADQGIAGITTAGKILLDLAAGESTLALDGVKPRLPAPAATLAQILRHRVETFIEMHKRLLDAAAEQAHLAVESYKEGNGLDATAHITEVARQGIAGFVETEKHFLDLVAEEVAAAATASREGRKPSRAKGKALTQLAREGVDQFIGAQKALLDLAIKQAEQVSQRAEDAAEEAAVEEAEPRTSLAELTQKTVQNFVTAQKSLLEIAVKPARVSAQTVNGSPKTARRPKRKR